MKKENITRLRELHSYRIATGMVFEKKRRKEDDTTISDLPIFLQLPPRTTKRCNNRKGSYQWRIPTSSLCFFLWKISLLTLPLVRSFQSSSSLDVVFCSRSQKRPTNQCNYSPNKSPNPKDAKITAIGLSATAVGLSSTPLLR